MTNVHEVVLLVLPREDDLSMDEFSSVLQVWGDTTRDKSCPFFHLNSFIRNELV